MRIEIESWSPEYGAPMDAEVLRPPTETLVDASVERHRDDWVPIEPPDATEGPEVLYFVDGVRRIDARVWITGDDGEVRPGVCATFAAGIVRCAQDAEVIEARVERRLVSRGGPGAFQTDAGEYTPRAVPEDDLDTFFAALQTDMRAMEASIARALELGTGDLVIFDGPIGEGRDVRPALGYIKSHRVAYLDETLGKVVGELTAGQRTPMFVIGEKFPRYTWYVRLPSSGAAPWSGIVRCEVVGDMDVGEAAGLANFSSSALPRFASESHKDPRAPQNLYPIGALERQLRRLMGDSQFVERSLRKAVRNFT